MPTKVKQGTSANRTLVSLQKDWSAGSRQDKPRDQIPANAAWLLTDVVPDATLTTGAGSPLRSRNGWVRTCTAMSSTASATAAAVGFGNFSGTNSGRILGIDEDGRLYKWTPGNAVAAPDSDGASTLVGTAVVPQQAPINYRASVYILARGSTGYTYDGTTLGAMSGSPPQAAFGCVFKDHLVVADDGTTDNRIWFASAGDPTDWNTAADGQWLDASSSVYGIATFQNMILVFQDGLTERLRGDVIPGVLNSDMVREPLFPQGTTSAKSVCVTKDGVIFANSDGIFMTDGLQVYDLTSLAGMGEYWKEIFRPASSNVSIAASLYKDWYVWSAATTPYFSGALNVKHNQFVLFTNLKASMMLTTPTTAFTNSPPRLLMAEAANPNVTDIGVMLDAVSAYTDADGDGTVIAPQVETRYYQGNELNPTRWRTLYLTGGGDVPAGGTTIMYSDTPHVDPATVLTSTHTLAGTPSRSRVHMGKVSRGFSFTITPAFSSGTTSTTGFHLDALEAEVTPLYGRRR